jgi:hypothetical protein
MATYQVIAVIIADGLTQVRQTRQLQEYGEFANQWNINLKSQGFGQAVAGCS